MLACPAAECELLRCGLLYQHTPGGEVQSSSAGAAESPQAQETVLLAGPQVVFADLAMTPARVHISHARSEPGAAAAYSLLGEAAPRRRQSR